jgi:hypothetical protein
MDYGLWIMNGDERLRRENGTPTARRPYLGEDGGHRRAALPARSILIPNPAIEEF